MEVLSGIIKQTKSLSGSRMKEKLIAEITGLEKISDQIETNKKLYKKLKPSTVDNLDLSAVLKDYRKGRGINKVLKQLPVDIDQLIKSSKKLIVIIDKIYPNGEVNSNYASASQLAAAWYAFSIIYASNYVLRLVNTVVLANLPESIRDSIGVTSSTAKLLKGDAYNVGATVKACVDFASMEKTIEYLPDTVYDANTNYTNYFSAIDPKLIRNAPILRTNGLFGGAVLAVRTVWLYTVDAWYGLKESRIQRLKVSMGILEMAKQDEYSVALEDKLTDLSDKIQVLESDLDSYREDTARDEYAMTGGM